MAWAERNAERRGRSSAAVALARWLARHLRVAGTTTAVGLETKKLDRELSEALGLEIALFGIAAVLPTRKGRGVLASTHCDVLRWCGENGVKFARGRVLVDSYSMQKLCLITGASVTAVFHTFYKHLGVYCRCNLFDLGFGQSRAEALARRWRVLKDAGLGTLQRAPVAERALRGSTASGHGR
ncbi:MAG: hypothetical protein HYR48_01020 [Gemmatimonadetes bacterium]|nr:hypothetical protein [Gemmatimonadota bacterium]